MAIQWGSWNGGSNPFRVGIDLSVSGTTITAEYYVEATYSVSDSMTLTFTGSITGSVTFRKEGPSAVKVATKTRTGTRGSSYSFGAKLSGVYNGATPSVSDSITVPAAPPSTPGRPTVSNIKSNGARFAWSAPSNNNGASIAEYQIAISTSSSFPGGSTDTASAGTSRSYTSTSRAANTTYWARVRARNSAGWSSWSSSRSFTTAVDSPAAPTNASATRVSDTQISLSWTRNATSGAPYKNILVQRWSNVTESYATIATISGSATSYTDTTAVASRRFRYRIRARNDGGTSNAATSNYVSTTPPAPTGLVATKDTTDIDLAWSLPSNADGLVSHIEVWHAANNTWEGSPLATLSSGTATTYTHVSPNPAQTHTYRVRTRAALDTPTLTSAYSSNSNTIQLLAPPNAPTDLAPAGSAVDADAEDGIVLSWRHNPADSTSQTRYSVRYREQGSSTWTTVSTVTSNVKAYTIASGVLSNGNVYEWQARTYGQHPDPSPWSSTATFTTSARPIATITAPIGSHDRSTVVVEWEFYDPEETGQTAYRVTLIDEVDESTLAVVTAASADTSRTLGVVVQDGGTYRVEVEVADGAGLWSDPAVESFVVDYAEPPLPVVGGEWDLSAGAVHLSIEYPEPTGSEVPPVEATVSRSVDGGETWEIVAERVPADAGIVTDPLPLVDAENLYRVVTYSDLPSSSATEPVAVLAGPGLGHAWINGGPAFGDVVRLRGNLSLSRSVRRDRTLRKFAGRRLPVIFTGDGRTSTLSLTGRIGPDTSTFEEFEAFADLGGIACYRDSQGRRLFVSVDEVGLSTRAVTSDISVSMTEAERT